MGATITIMAIGAATGVGVTSYLEGDKAQRKANAQMLTQQQEQKKLEDELKARRAKEEGEVEASRLRDEARERQRRNAAGATGRGDTILTSPLGVTGTAAGEKKTLLGT